MDNDDLLEKIMEIAALPENTPKEALMTVYRCGQERIAKLTVYYDDGCMRYVEREFHEGEDIEDISTHMIGLMKKLHLDHEQYV